MHFLNLFVVLCVLSMSALFCDFGIAGNDHGNGGDSKPWELGSGWFLGSDKTIRVCTVAAAEFPVSQEEIERTITAVFQTWKQYYAEKYVALNMVNPLFFPAFSVSFHKCDGSEDVKFYFGVSNEEVEKAKAEYYDPMAFAYRSKYDLDMGWGKGFVWVAPKASSYIPWDFPYRLHGILLHEVGHVLGCDHVHGTIMTEEVAKLIRTASTSPEHVKQLLTTIDGEVELKLRMNDIFDLEGKLSRWGTEESEKTFKLFVGRPPVGKITAKIHKELPGGKLAITDEKGTISFPFWVKGGSSTPFVGGVKIFKGVRNVEYEGKKFKERNWTSAAEGQVNFGTIRTASDTSIPIILSRNMGSAGSPAVVQYIDASSGDFARDLFVSEVPTKEPMGGRK